MSDNVRERFMELPDFLSNHLRLTVVALCLGVLISIPLAIFLVRHQKARYPVLTVAGVIQTAPALALLALMVPLIDKTGGFGIGIRAFGFYPAIIALTLYSILPILRNTVTGILGVDSAMTEAARGVGMTDWQMMWQVQMPLAAPVIIAGIRTATVWTVGIATLATPIGQSCLGNYIFAGLQTRNWTMVMFGVVAAAGLALVLDLLIGGLQRAVEQRRRPIGIVCGASLAVIVVGGLASPTIVQAIESANRVAAAGSTSSDKADDSIDRPIRVGAKTFTEQYILSALISDELEATGFATERTESLGSIIVFEALSNGDIDVYVDYSGTIWANAMQRTEFDSRWSVLAQLTGWLADSRGVRCLGSLGFENAYALAMRREHAEALGVESMDDLAAHAGNMSIGGDYEFFGRPEWKQIRSAYGLDFASQTSFDSSIMYQAVATGQVDVISAFSSDGRIAAFDLVVLQDTRSVIPPYDAVVLLGPTVADNEVVVRALEPLIGAIDVALMRQANHLVDRDDDAQTVSQAARWLREQLDNNAEHEH